MLTLQPSPAIRIINHGGLPTPSTSVGQFPIRPPLYQQQRNAMAQYQQISHLLPPMRQSATASVRAMPDGIARMPAGGSVPYHMYNSGRYQYAHHIIPRGKTGQMSGQRVGRTDGQTDSSVSGDSEDEDVSDDDEDEDDDGISADSESGASDDDYESHDSDVIEIVQEPDSPIEIDSSSDDEEMVLEIEQKSQDSNEAD